MRRKRILVVDDDRSILQLYRTTLSLAGFEVDIASDGLSALQKIESDGPPDLIVLDLYMPYVDGLTVLSELRATSATASIPVVIVTGTEHEAVFEKTTAILKKPCAPEQLITAIERHVSTPGV